MLARPLLFLWLLLAPLSALASLDAREPVVTLWSLPAGFAFGLVSLWVRPSRRWLFLAAPVALGTFAITADAFVPTSSIPPWEVAMIVSVVAGVLMLQAGAGFLLALIAKLSFLALRRLGASGGTKSDQSPPLPKV
jgi:peptidoglycan/LPS O-acetylase OafA/YrhL